MLRGGSKIVKTRNPSNSAGLLSVVFFAPALISGKLS